MEPKEFNVVADVAISTKMSEEIKVVTWNLCLGLADKKDVVTTYLNSLNISVCCLQKTKIQIDFPEKGRIR